MTTQTGDQKSRDAGISELRPIEPYGDPDWRIHPVGDWVPVEGWSPFAWDDPLIKVTVLDANVPDWDADLIVELHDRLTDERAHYLARMA